MAIVIPRFLEVNSRRDEQPADGLGRKFGPPREDEGGQTGNMGRGKRGARGRAILVVEGRSEHAEARRDEIERGPSVAERCQIILVVCRAYGEGRVMRRGIGQGARRVARRGDEHNAHRVRVVEDVAQDECALLPAPTHVDHMRAVFHGVENRRGEIVFFQKTTAAAFDPVQASAQGHELRVRRDARDTHLVICRGCDNARDACSVRGFIAGVVVPVEVIARARHARCMGKIPSSDVVDVPVVVVVNPLCAAQFCVIVPNIIAEVFVVVIYAGVDDCDDDLFFYRAEGLVQGFPTEGLETSLRVVARVIGLVREYMIGLGIDHVWARCVIGCGCRRVAGQVNAIYAHQGMGMRGFGTPRREQGFDPGRAMVVGQGWPESRLRVAELDENLAGRIIGLRVCYVGKTKRKGAKCNAPPSRRRCVGQGRVLGCSGQLSVVSCQSPHRPSTSET